MAGWAAASGGHGGQADGGIVAHGAGGFQGHVAGALGGPFVGLLENNGANQAGDAPSLVKMSTTSVLRLISPLRRSMGLVTGM